MRQAEQVPSVFLRRCAAGLLAALLLLLAGCAGKEESAPEPTELPVETEPKVELPQRAVFYALVPDVPCYREATAGQEDFLGTMKEGTVVSLVDERDGMMLVQWNEGQVWCSAWYLAAQDPELEEQRDAARMEKLASAPGYALYDAPEERFCMSSWLNCRETPDADGPVLASIPYSTAVTAYGQANGFCLVRLPDGRLCYCASAYLAGGEQCAVYPGAVDLRALLPSAQFDLLFASDRNITGRALYPAIPLLEEYTAGLLYQAYEQFLADGYTLKIYDAYRPLSAQFALYDIVQNSAYIANPYTWGSWHQRGRAVDISLVDLATGEELEMPTPMHTFDRSAMRSSSRSWTEAARSNVDYMTRVMKSVGFGTIQTEWWHFEYTGAGNYMPTELDYDALTYRHITEYFD